MTMLENGPAHGVTLFLQRAPFLLRVTQKQVGNEWDALDQLSDKAEADENIFVYYAQPKRMGMAFFDGVKDGRRCGWWSVCASYQFLESQPPDKAIRDNDEWVLWCAASAQNKDMAAKFEAWKEANKE